MEEDDDPNGYYISDSKQSINLIIESTTNQKWLERKKKKTTS